MPDVKSLGVEGLLTLLEKRATDLNEATQKANEAISAVEARLVSLKLGLEYWHPTPIARSEKDGGVGAYDTTTQTLQALGFAKVEGAWRLVVKPFKQVNGHFQGDRDCPYQELIVAGEPTLLSKASRGLRVAAVSMLPDFLSGLSEQVEAAIATVDNATAKL